MYSIKKMADGKLRAISTTAPKKPEIFYTTVAEENKRKELLAEQAAQNRKQATEDNFDRRKLLGSVDYSVSKEPVYHIAKHGYCVGAVKGRVFFQEIAKVNNGYSYPYLLAKGGSTGVGGRRLTRDGNGTFSDKTDYVTEAEMNAIVKGTPTQEELFSGVHRISDRSTAFNPDLIKNVW